jgi:hypothetical protein
MSQQHRVIVKGKVYVALTRRNELWAGAALDTEALNKIAVDENKLDINKVEAARDIYAELRLKLRELGVW